MGNRYSREELGQIASLVDEGLTNREIAATLGRPEAGIRNLRYRLSLKGKARENFRCLHSQRERLEAQIEELNQSIIKLSGEVKCLEEKKAQIEIVLDADKESIEARIENELISLKTKKPELFYIRGEEQLAKLVGYFLRWLLS